MGLISILSVFLKACGLAVLLLLLRALAWLASMLVIAPVFDTMKRLPGETGAFFQSYLDDVLDPQQSADTHNRWRKLYGNTFRFQGFGRHDNRLMTFDFRAISHILTSPVYEKPWQTRSILASLVGRGIFSMEGTEHKAQRKILGPAFSAQNTKELTPIFQAKAEELCDQWDSVVSQTDSSGDLAAQQSPVIDVSSSLGKAVFDAQGLAGFDYAFDSLQDDSKPDYQAYRELFRVVDQGVAPRDIIDLYAPILRKIWPSEKTAKLNKATSSIRHLGRKIIERKRAQVINGESDGKDILGVLVRSSLSSEPSARLSDRDLLDQCTTFLFAGTDTVSIGLTWALRQLSLHPGAQTRLFEELRASRELKTLDGYDSEGSDDSGFVEDPAVRSAHTPSSQWAKSLDSLPFLDSVVRETLRICPPVHSTIRVATKDDEIVLSEPICVDGRPASSVSIRKGTYIHIPIEGINYAEEIWGADAHEFSPDRWTKLPETATSLPGIGNLMTFGYGPHSCLGHRFAVAEMKVFLAAMVLRFEFKPVESASIKKWNSFVTRPYVEEIGRSKPQLPLHVSRRL
ncbi:cytochrome P450 [Ephemerocybe angulata]|uniref:Cytochrome P450 n=1 Tax=Ephemerocybe angulata TaxID=980116 RepID=A0A8H6IJ74_9AGAR|nr:cytochrome P450 [Tulosesus angulatus]